MNRTELQKLLMQVGSSSLYEALVSVDSADLRAQYGEDRDAFYQAKGELTQQLADRIRCLVADDGTVDVFEDVGQIVVSANVGRWRTLLKLLENLENSEHLKAKIHPNDKVPLIN